MWLLAALSPCSLRANFRIPVACLKPSPDDPVRRLRMLGKRDQDVPCPHRDIWHVPKAECILDQEVLL